MTMKQTYIPQTGRTQLGIVDTNFLKNKKIDDLLYGYIRIHSKWHMGENYTYCYKDLVTFSKVIKYFKEEGAQPYPYKSKTTFAAHLKTLKEAGWIYEGGQFPESGSDQEVFSLAELFKGQYVIMSLDTMTLLVNTAIPNIIKTYSFLKFKMVQHNYLKQKKPDIPKYSFSRKSLLETIGYTSPKQNKNDMMDEILNTLQEKGLIKIHIEHKAADGRNIKNPFFVLDEVYEADRTREKEEVVEKAVYFPSQQEQNNKDEEIFIPQINSADYLKSLSIDEIRAELRRREIESEWAKYF